MPRQPECASSRADTRTEGLCARAAKGAAHADTQPRLLAIKAIVRDPSTSTREQWTNVVVGWHADYWEPSTIATIASWLRRAHRHGYSEAAEIAENQTEPPERRVP
jgi:hypothetical protein